MKAWLIPVAVLGLVASGGVARADQCAYLSDAEVAEEAARVLARHTTFVELCEPCGDTEPGAPTAIETISVQEVSGTPYREVQVNGRGIDLAYAYVPVDARHHGNLAELAGCPASGVSSSIALASGTPPVAGVQPRAFAQPPPPYAVAAAPILARPTPAEPPSPALTIVHVTESPVPVGWLALCAAGAATLTSLIWAALLAVLLRRRRSLLPRATNLRP